MTALEDHLSRQVERSERFFWNRLRWQLVAEFLPDAGSSEVVDVGAGPGFLGRFLERRSPEVSYRFIEPIDTLEELLTARYGEDSNFRERRSFGDARFVTLLDVLEHQANDALFMRELAEKLAPGAVLVLTVPAMSWLWSGWDEALGHYRRYDKATLERAIAGLPLETLEMSYLFPELVPPGLFRRFRRPSGSSELGSEAEFPDPSRLVNEALYLIGQRSLRLRRHWPAGTSLFAALKRR